MLPPEAQSERSAQPNDEAASNQPAIQDRIHNMNMSSYSYMTERKASPKCIYRTDRGQPLPATRRSRSLPRLAPAVFQFSH